MKTAIQLSQPFIAKDAKRAWANQQLIARLVRNTYFAISSGPGMDPTDRGTLNH